MKHNHEKSAQSVTSSKNNTLNLQPRAFVPIQSDPSQLNRKTEDALSESKGTSSKNLLEKIISTSSPSPSNNPIQRKLQYHFAPIQAKLNIGEPNDKYEKEADHTAAKVVQQINLSPQNQSLQRNEALEEEDEELQRSPIISTIQRNEALEEEDEELQRSPLVQRRENIGGGEASSDLESSIQSARGRGQSLESSLQAKMAQAMGADFSGVKVHTDSQSDQLNKSIQAKAFTTGQDVFFRQGAYNPSSKSGQELIAHELTHVVQQNGGSIQRSPQNMIIQRKGEFKSQYQKNPGLAKAAVKADYSNYASHQNDFELKLGVGLHKNKSALDGATIMLAKMGVAMEAAGFSQEKIDKSFALKGGEELGGVLLKDVNQAILSGNLREKMGMVYQARFAIAEALNTLREKDDPKIPLGEEIQSEEMAKSITGLKKDVHPSQAILKRRDSISKQPRQSNESPHQKLITGENLKDLGVPLSEREERAAKEEDIKGKKDRRFVPGSEYYVVHPEQRAKEQEKLRRVISGLSGSTDMYFHIAKHLDMDESERKLLRLASLGQMIVNNDHSYHEIMHVAKTQGGLDDYPDDLPIGYTTLDPLSEDGIINTTTLADFPGDQQVRDSMAELTMTKGDITTVGGEAAKRSHRYPAILAKVDEYHQNPKMETLEEIKRLVDVWINAKKPGSLSLKGTKTQWENSPRRKKLVELKNEVEHLLKVESEYLKLDLDSAKSYILDQLANAPEDKQSFIQKKMENFINSYIQKMTKDSNLGKKLDKVKAQQAQQELERKKKELNKIKDLLTGTTDDWQSKDFRAKKSDLDSDLSTVNIPDTGIYGKLTSPLKSDLKQDLKGYLIDNREIIETLGGDVSNVPDLREKKVLSPLQQRMAKKDKDAELDNIRKNPVYTQDQEDFVDNIDTSMMDALKPGTPMDNLLRQVEGKPMPQELEAINAYAQDGFYQMMNKILNNSKNKEFMKTVPKEAKTLVSLAVSGLRKMKPYEGSVYRGEHGGLSSKDVNKLIQKPKLEREQILKDKFNQDEHYKQFISTSKRPYQAYSTKAGKWMAIEIRNVKTGVDISAISNTIYEREVLFPPNVTLKVVSVEDKFVTKVVGTKGKETLTDLGNKYAEAPIADPEGRVKVVYEEV